MTNYGFIIDNRKCIGCHAYTVACKAEHEVPVGVNRTWVKYIENGEFPDTQRNSKWLNELSNKNPLWINPKDAEQRGIRTGDLVQVTTEIGYSINHAWVTEGIAPGAVACSHHIGRWRRHQDKADRWNNSLVDITREENSWMLRQVEGPAPHESSDPDTKRIFWSDGGVHQNLTFPVHPDPVGDTHCWHNAVYVEEALQDDRYGDVYVDLAESKEFYCGWLCMTRPGPLESGLKRPQVFDRPYRPDESFYYVKQESEATSPK